MVEAGEDWDAFVARAVAEEWIGVEALSGIPGTVGADADPERRRLRPGGRRDDRARCTSTTGSNGVRGPCANADCGFGYRTSVFKREPGRFVVGAVTFQFRLGQPRRRRCSTPSWPGRSASRSASGWRRRGCARRCSSCVAARAWCSIRADHDTWSAGSFFTNPFVEPADAARGRAGVPAAGRLGQDERGLADRAGRVRQGLRERPGQPLDQAHARADQPRLGHDGGPAGPGAPRSATASGRPSASTSTPNPPSSTATSNHGPSWCRVARFDALIACWSLSRQAVRCELRDHGCDKSTIGCRAILRLGARLGSRQVSQVSMSARTGPDVGGAQSRGPTSGPARPAPRRRSPGTSRAASYCAEQPGAEQQRVVGAERDPHAGVEQLRAAARPPGRGRRRARRSTVGHISQVTPSSARCATSCGSSIDRTP